MKRIKDLKQAVDHYRKKLLAYLPKKTEAPCDNDSYLDYILSGRPEEAKIAFRKAEKLIISRLNQCKCFEEVSIICNEAFGSIKNIGEQTILAYVNYALSVRDIDPESNCYNLLTRPARSTLKKCGFINGKNVVTFKENTLFKDFETIEFIDFANKNYRSFSQVK